MASQPDYVSNIYHPTHSLKYNLGVQLLDLPIAFLVELPVIVILLFLLPLLPFCLSLLVWADHNAACRPFG